MLPNGWKKVKLGDVVKMSSGGTPSKDNASFWNGDIPWISALEMHKNFVEEAKLNITEEALKKGSSLAKKNDLLLLTRGSMLWKRIPVCLCLRDVAFNQDVKCLHANEKLNSTFLLYWFGCMEPKIMHMVVGTGIGAGKLESSGILDLDVNLPPLEEQKKIAATLSVWDSAIEKMEKLIEAKENSYDCFLATSIMSDTYAELGTFLTEVSERNKDENIQQVLSVSNSKGFVLPEEQFDRKVASENLSNYKIVRIGQYAYNPSRINVGSIARLNDWKEAVISPMYTVFEIGNQKQLDSDFLLHWLNSSEAKQRIKNSAQGSVRETVGFGDLCKIKIPKFDLKKQQKIVSVLNTMNQEISLFKQQLKNYKKQKQGLMQKLLTGQWRVK